MNKDSIEAANFIDRLCIEPLTLNTKAIICTPNIFLKNLIDSTVDTKVEIGSQNIFHKAKGAFTGEVSSAMLASIGCKYTIVGHSERRQFFNESNSEVRSKINLALKSDIIPIFCIGESLHVRQEGKTFDFLRSQLTETLKGIDDCSKLLIAYEPIWAIGTGNVPSIEEIDEVFNYINKFLKNSLNIDTKIPLIYGGSVSMDNAKDIISVSLVSGFLIGGASLDVESYISIYKQM